MGARSELSGVQFRGSLPWRGPQTTRRRAEEVDEEFALTSAFVTTTDGVISAVCPERRQAGRPEETLRSLPFLWFKLHLGPRGSCEHSRHSQIKAPAMESCHPSPPLKPPPRLPGGRALCPEAFVLAEIPHLPLLHCTERWWLCSVGGKSDLSKPLRPRHGPSLANSDQRGPWPWLNPMWYEVENGGAQKIQPADFAGDFYSSGHRPLTEQLAGTRSMKHTTY